MRSTFVRLRRSRRQLAHFSSPVVVVVDRRRSSSSRLRFAFVEVEYECATQSEHTRARRRSMGPFTLPGSAEDELAKTKKLAIARVREWVELRLPRAHVESRECVVDVSEVQCGDPDCAPIDAVIRIIYGRGCGCAFGIPCEVQEVEEADIDSQMPPDEVIADWADGVATPWPPAEEDVVPGPVPTETPRFAVGTRVECRIGPGPEGWAVGTVVAHWYRGSSWPADQYAPYQIQLDRTDMGSGLIFAPTDEDTCIRQARITNGLH